MEPGRRIAMAKIRWTRTPPLELAGSKEAIFLYARRNGGAYSRLTAGGGGLPSFN